MEDKYLTYVLLAVLVICFTLNPFMKKRASGKLNSNEYMILNHALITILIVIYFIYIFKTNKCDINCLKKLDKGDMYWAIGAAISGIVGSLILIMLIKREDVTFIMPQVQPIVIALGLLIGYFVFKEKITTLKIIGTVMIIGGVFVLNWDKRRISKK